MGVRDTIPSPRRGIFRTMKVFLIILYLIDPASSRTWLEIAREADFKNDHPGRLATEITPDSEALNYHELRLKVLTEVVKGDPAPYPSSSEAAKLKSSISIGILDISRLAEFRASQQDWKGVFEALELSADFKSLILKSEPTILWYLTVTFVSRTALSCAEHISEIESPEKRNEVLRKLRDYSVALAGTRTEFAITEKAEIRRRLLEAKSLKERLSRIKLDHDLPPLWWNPEMKPRLSIRDLLKLPFNAELSEKRALAIFKDQYHWIRSRQSSLKYQELNGQGQRHDLSFYQEHQNGLFEIFLNCQRKGSDAAGYADRIEMLGLANTVAWKWLEYEMKKEPPRVADDLINLLKPREQLDIARRKFEINFLERTIIVPKTNTSISHLTLQIDVPHFTRD